MNFLYWLRNQADKKEVDEWKTDGMRNEQKRHMVRMWLIYRARGYQTEVTTEDVVTVGIRNGGRDMDGWYTQEQMDLTFGPNTAKRWRESNIMDTQPCRVTNSTRPEHLEYWCKDLTQAKRTEVVDDRLHNVVAKAKAEERRAQAVAIEQEMLAKVQEAKALVMDAEELIPAAILGALKIGLLTAARKKR